MNTEDIKKEIRIWNRWGYNPFTQEIICYTDWIVDFDDKKSMWEITFKPKTWIAKVSARQALEILKSREFRKTFRYDACLDEIFTEYEKPAEN